MNHCICVTKTYPGCPIHGTHEFVVKSRKGKYFVRVAGKEPKDQWTDDRSKATFLTREEAEVVAMNVKGACVVKVELSPA